MTLPRRIFLGAALAAVAAPALAHHGWRWTDAGEFELTGVITDAELGNPHGILTIDAEGESGSPRSASRGATSARA
jgi:hypothetical protein